jgi:hypothetical protein
MVLARKFHGPVMRENPHRDHAIRLAAAKGCKQVVAKRLDTQVE